MRKIYHNGTKIPNNHEIHQHFPSKCPPKYAQIGLFGMKIYHLATLVPFSIYRFYFGLRTLTGSIFRNLFSAKNDFPPNFQIFKFSNFQIFKFSNFQIFFKFSNFQIFKFSNFQIFKGSYFFSTGISEPILRFFATGSSNMSSLKLGHHLPTLSLGRTPEPISRSDLILHSLLIR
jgi:hypothetical protein